MNFIFQKIDISYIKRISFRKDINGLRAIAVLAVVFYHSEFELFKGGWLGVDIFFVISGYLISNIIISELNEGTFSFKTFYTRRIRRILPALLSTVVLSLPLAYWLLTPRALIEFSKSIFSSIFFYSNYYFQNLDFYNAEPTKVMPLLHTWSLAIEEQFYLLFPFICFVFYKLNKKYFSITLLLISLFSIYLNSTTTEIIKFYQIQFRAWELIFGSIAMILQHKVWNIKLNNLGFIFIVTSIFYFDDSMLTLNSIEPRLLAVFGTFLVLTFENKNFLNNFLSNKFISIIGVYSFSIYLFHQPIFAFYRLFLVKYELKTNSFAIFLILLTLFLLSFLNWKFVEICFQKTSKKSLIIYIFLCTSISLVFAYFSINSDGFKQRYDYIPEEVLFYSQFTNIYPGSFESENYIFKNRNCDLEIFSNSYCYWFDASSDKNIFLIGDSHTNALSVSFLTNLTSAQKEYNLVFLSGNIGRCLLSQQSDTVGDVVECSDQFFNEFLDLLDKDKDLVIAFGRFDTWLTDKGKNEIKCNNCDYIKIFKNRLESIAKNSKNVLIIEPIPTYSYSISDSYLFKKNTWGEPVSIDKNMWLEELKDLNIFFNDLNKMNLIFISSEAIFCNIEGQNKCFASTRNELYYSDSNHLTLSGANLITTKVNIVINSIINSS